MVTLNLDLEHFHRNVFDASIDIHTYASKRSFVPIGEFVLEEDCAGVTFIGLDIIRDKIYHLYANIINASGATDLLYLIFNENYTLSEYRTEKFYGERQNVNATDNVELMSIIPQYGSTGFIHASIMNNPKLKTWALFRAGVTHLIGEPRNYFGTVRMAPDYDNIVSIGVASNVAEGIGIGSRFQIVIGGFTW